MFVKQRNDTIKFLWKQSKQYIIQKHKNGMKVGALVSEYGRPHTIHDFENH
jgi:hypothetical protein